MRCNWWYLVLYIECVDFLKDNLKTIIHQIYDARGSNKAKNKAGSRK